MAQSAAIVLNKHGILGNRLALCICVGEVQIRVYGRRAIWPMARGRQRARCCECKARRGRSGCHENVGGISEPISRLLC